MACHARAGCCSIRMQLQGQGRLPIASGIRPIAPGPRPPGLQLHTMLQQGKAEPLAWTRHTFGFPEGLDYIIT